MFDLQTTHLGIKVIVHRFWAKILWDLLTSHKQSCKVEVFLYFRTQTKVLCIFRKSDLLSKQTQWPLLSPHLQLSPAIADSAKTPSSTLQTEASVPCTQQQCKFCWVTNGAFSWLLSSLSVSLQASAHASFFPYPPTCRHPPRVFLTSLLFSV